MAKLVAWRAAFMANQSNPVQRHGRQDIRILSIVAVTLCLIGLALCFLAINLWYQDFWTPSAKIDLETAYDIVSFDPKKGTYDESQRPTVAKFNRKAWLDTTLSGASVMFILTSCYLVHRSNKMSKALR